MNYIKLILIISLVFSLSPFLIFLILLFLKRASLFVSSLVTLLSTGIISLLFWKVAPTLILSSLTKGFLIAFDIFVIIFGAIFFFEVLKENKIIENAGRYLESFSKDYRIRVILLAWFLENFIEGTAGFGTPCAVVAPLLIALGLSPISAVIISLLGNSASVAFGAAGTPIRIGFSSLIIGDTPFYSAIFNSIGFIVPIFMLWAAVSSQKNKKIEFFEVLPFAIWSGIAYTLPTLYTVFLGQEFPAIVGSVIGLLLVLLTMKLGIFMPRHIRDLHEDKDIKPNISLLKVVTPYIILIFLLFIGKFLLGSLSIPIDLFGIKHNFSLFNPGFAFILAGLPIPIILGNAKFQKFKYFSSSFKRTIIPFLIIIFMSSMVQILIASPSLKIITTTLKTPLLPFISPFIGAFGSFMTGSATISNIMFGNFLYTVGEELSFIPQKILALEVVGAAAGNMIALVDILAVEAVVGIKNKDIEILKSVAIPCLIYITLAGIIGMAFIKII